MTKRGTKGVGAPDPEPIEKAATRALAKALSFQRVGKPADAAEWAASLVNLLRDAGIQVSA